MTESKGAPPSAVERRRTIRQGLEESEPPLRVIAEDVLALSSRIDLVAVDSRGQLVTVMIAGDGADGRLLTTALAHRSWLHEHARDWLKLAPDLGIDGTAPIRSLLIAEHFDPETRIAAASLPEGAVELLRLVEIRQGERLQTGFEQISPHRSGAYRPVAKTRTAPGMALPPFRSGLSAQDLALTDEESTQLDE